MALMRGSLIGIEVYPVLVWPENNPDGVQNMCCVQLKVKRSIAI